MTREFDKQRRDDSRPSFRNTSPNNYNNTNERSPRPARPRLNREMVDRAWENGAPRVHADYRPRNRDGQAPRNNWRGSQSEEHTSQNRNNGYRQSNQYTNNERANNRPGNQRFERSGDGNRGPHPRNFDDNRGPRNFDDNRGPRNFNEHRGGPRSYGDNRRYEEDRNAGNRGPRSFGGNQRSDGPGNYRGYNNGPARTNDRPWNNDRRPGQDRRGPYQSQEGYGRRGVHRNEPPPRGPRPTFNKNKPSRDEEEGLLPPRNLDHPRSLSRPESFHPQQTAREEHAERKARRYGRFEGDYEQFSGEDTPPDAPRREYRPRQDEPEAERHVTRMPDGRVLKGPRPAQRKNAQFWTNIADDTQELMSNVHPTPQIDEGEPSSELTEQATEEATPHNTMRPGARRGLSGAKRQTASGKTRSSGPRPSRRGFKWPTP